MVIQVSQQEIQDFEDTWPCANMRGITMMEFEFDERGDFMDYRVLGDSTHTDADARDCLISDARDRKLGTVVNSLQDCPGDGKSGQCCPEHVRLQDEEKELLWACTSSGRIELSMTLEEARSASHSGQCDDDVLGLSKLPHIASQLEAIDPELLRGELREFGAWDAEELADHDQNLQRLLWSLAGDLVEESPAAK